MRIGPNVFLRTDGRWEARYQKGRDQDGKIIYGFAYGATQDEAEHKRVLALHRIKHDMDTSSSHLASLNPSVSTPNIIINDNKRNTFRKEKFEAPFNEENAGMVYSCLSESTETCAIAFLLCLHLGISTLEIAALRFVDINLEKREVSIVRTTMAIDRKLFVIDALERVIPIPEPVFCYLIDHRIGDKNKTHYVFTDSLAVVESLRTVETSFRRIIKPRMNAKGLSSSSLRSTFIRRCLEANMNIETVAALSGADKNSIYRCFGLYIKADPNAINRLYVQIKHSSLLENRHLNLLILGAGSHGNGVKETAEKLGIFQSIKFLDDNIAGNDIIGTCLDYLSFCDEFPAAFPAFGNNKLRRAWTIRLRNAGYMLPRLIHPDTTISNNVEIGEGTIIMAQATVNSGAKIGKSCIVATNGMVGFDASVGSYSHIDCGSIVMKTAYVPEMTVIESGAIYRAR